jgi:calcineurin-like phosphoesterase
MIGDVIGKPGRHAVEAIVPALRDRRSIDFVTANGENLAGGMGLTLSVADALFAVGVDVITSGNHIWDKKEIYPALESIERILRPLNYGTSGVPGRGWSTYQALDGTDLAVINLQGRTYMQPIENPFLEADRLLDEASEPLPTVASLPSSERTPTFPPRTTGSFPPALPTRATSAAPARRGRSSGSIRRRSCRGS